MEYAHLTGRPYRVFRYLAQQIKHMQPTCEPCYMGASASVLTQARRSMS